MQLITINVSINDGSCLYDLVPVGIGGCTDINAINFVANATVNNGTCQYHVQGCTNEMACNYDFRATVIMERVNSLRLGCASRRACNYNAAATHPSDCEFVLKIY